MDANEEPAPDPGGKPRASGRLHLVALVLVAIVALAVFLVVLPWWKSNQQLTAQQHCFSIQKSIAEAMSRYTPTDRRDPRVARVEQLARTGGDPRQLFEEMVRTGHFLSLPWCPATPHDAPYPYRLTFDAVGITCLKHGQYQ